MASRECTLQDCADGGFIPQTDNTVEDVPHRECWKNPDIHSLYPNIIIVVISRPWCDAGIPIFNLTFCRSVFCLQRCPTLIHLYSYAIFYLLSSLVINIDFFFVFVVCRTPDNVPCFVTMSTETQGVLPVMPTSSLECLTPFSLYWRHNDHDGVSNHQPHGCVLDRLFRRRSKKTSNLCVTGLCMGNSPGPVNSHHKGPVTRKLFPFDDVIMLTGSGPFRYVRPHAR